MAIRVIHLPVAVHSTGDAQQSAFGVDGHPKTLRSASRQNGKIERSRGFSFTEILFAVIILGIGFIMVAAILPVAIQQGKVTTEEGTATGVAREAMNYLAQVGANSDANPNSNGGPLFPATGVSGSIAPYYGTVYSFIDPQPNPPASPVQTNPTSQPFNFPLNTPQQPILNPLLVVPVTTTSALWNKLNLSLIVPSDQRFAFVGLYKRDGNPFDRRTWAPYAQVWFIPVTPRSRSIYAAGTLAGPGVDITTSNLQAHLVKVSIDADPSATYQTTSAAGSSVHYILYNWAGSAVPGGYQPNSLSENCFIIIADDQISTLNETPPNSLPVRNAGRMNGHIYHVGLRRPDLDATVTGGSTVTAYDLAPNGDFFPDPGADGLFGLNSVNNVDDDILTIGMTPLTTGTPGTTPTSPFTGVSPYGNANGPADAYVVGLDKSGADAGTSQDISAFTTFIKVN